MTKMKVLETGKIAEYSMGLIDPNDPTLPVAVTEVRVRRFGTQFLNIGAVGYGEKAAEDGHGFPVMLERLNGEFRLLVWADINREDPTHIISLEGARESLRQETESSVVFKAGAWVREDKRLGMVAMMSDGNLHIEWDDGDTSIVSVETARKTLLVVEDE